MICFQNQPYFSPDAASDSSESRAEEGMESAPTAMAHSWDYNESGDDSPPAKSSYCGDSPQSQCGESCSQFIFVSVLLTILFKGEESDRGVLPEVAKRSNAAAGGGCCPGKGLLPVIRRQVFLSTARQIRLLICNSCLQMS